jgi:phosphoglycerol transferase MdoB-like AlkP superfamily enzyme
MQTNRMLVLTGALIAILGSRLPWISVPVLYGMQGPAYESIEIGWEDNGFVTGGINLILLLVAIFWKGRSGKRYSVPGAILASLAIAVVLGCFLSILEIDPAEGFVAATDTGIYVTLFGAVLALAGALYRTAVPRKGYDTAIISSFL